MIKGEAHQVLPFTFVFGPLPALGNVGQQANAGSSFLTQQAPPCIVPAREKPVKQKDAGMSTHAGIEPQLMYSLPTFAAIIGQDNDLVISQYLRPKRVAHVRVNGDYFILGQWWFDFLLGHKVESETNAGTTWLTMNELTKKIRFSRRTIEGWIKTDNFPHERMGRNLRFDIEAVETWMQSRGV